mmetsp:Transcript_30393/g.72876  ORF Transcript_30393/g.72876 Transcript_30393/m.72876 type:complete len:171 (-) Transcript_30393:262-774(-)
MGFESEASTGYYPKGQILRSKNSPSANPLYPRSVEGAINYSHSSHVENMYQRQKVSRWNDDDEWKIDFFLRLPPWAVTWPGGQLSAIGRDSSPAMFPTMKESLATTALARSTRACLPIPNRVSWGRKVVEGFPGFDIRASCLTKKKEQQQQITLCGCHSFGKVIILQPMK